MHVILTMLIAGAGVLPEIDRRGLDIQARAEALEAPAPRRAGVRRAAQTGSLDLASITTICRAAGNQADPSRFLATLTEAYSMPEREAAALRSSCAAYLAGRADARRAAR